jgi:hypothetical protein
MSKHIPKVNRPHPSGMNGYQKLFRFENNRGASVVNFPGSYGTELAVLRFHGPEIDSRSLDYSTPLTDDVLGHLDDESLEAALDQIQALPAIQLESA